MRKDLVQALSMSAIGLSVVIMLLSFFNSGFGKMNTYSILINQTVFFLSVVIIVVLIYMTFIQHKKL